MNGGSRPGAGPQTRGGQPGNASTAPGKPVGGFPRRLEILAARQCGAAPARLRDCQYFWHDGKVIGRARAGTMGFDGKTGHNHWHFEQFARYALVTPAKTVAVASHKVGFCIAPVDAVDLLAPHAVWQPPFIGLGGACGSPTALWVTEELPVGWGDTYIQSIAGQNFDITGVPNGTYDIEVAANPEGVLHETTASNDVSFRKIILGGAPGHRTVKVPPWDGIDPEP